MLTINPLEVSVPKIHNFLLSSVAPRPICFASTIDKDGNPNLSPFSFFNVFSANPPIAIFSPARRGRDNTTKHTYENVKEVPEVVINVVNYEMVQQTSLASTEYAKGVNEFTKAGFTPLASEMVKPFRVKESPVQMECVVEEVVELGDGGGAGNLVICRIVLIHIDEAVLNEKGTIDQNKIDLVARLGGDYYCRASGDALFEVAKPLSTIGMGIDAIPQLIRNSKVLTGNNLGQLGNCEKLPTQEEINEFQQSEAFNSLLNRLNIKPENFVANQHLIAKYLLDEGNVAEAWKTLLLNNPLSK
jgi:flavin reductase (DIM6/NTAB) family NADH-FMN oxidoreductase RutF